MLDLLGSEKKTKHRFRMLFRCESSKSINLGFLTCGAQVGRHF